MAYSGIILAGGKGSRMGYREKALIDMNGRPLIQYVILSLEKVVDNIIISVRDREQGEMLRSRLPGYVLAYDVYENIGPLSGILSGLLASRDDYCFIAACDMPFINENVVKMLFKKCVDKDAAIPRWNDGSLEPLHAVYRREPMIRETKKAIHAGETIIIAPILKLDASYVSTEDLKKIDPDLITFKNINSPEDMLQTF